MWFSMLPLSYQNLLTKGISKNLQWMVNMTHIYLIWYSFELKPKMHNFIYWKKTTIYIRGRLSGKIRNIQLTSVSVKTFEMGGDKFWENIELKLYLWEVYFQSPSAVVVHQLKRSKNILLGISKAILKAFLFHHNFELHCI